MAPIPPTTRHPMRHAIRPWQGVRMRKAMAGADPDASPRPVALPAAWDDHAAAALAVLAPGRGPASLPQAAEAWIAPLAERARAAGCPLPLYDRLHALLRDRRGAPGAAAWRGERSAEPDFVLNLAAFHDPAAGFDVPAYLEAVDTAAAALAVLGGARPVLRIADLAGLLAALGIEYDSEGARNLGAHLARLLRDRLAAARPAVEALPLLPFLGAPAPILAGVAAPGLAEALLGVETGGIAPAFSAVGPDLRLTRSARVFLAARGLGAEAALAAVLAGEPVLRPAGAVAFAAMHDAVAPFLDAMPARPAAGAGDGATGSGTAVAGGAAERADPGAGVPPAPRRRDLPARRTGTMQRVSIGGHRLFLSTAEYAGGTLGEISISLPRESPSYRGLMECLAGAVSLGLQYGVPLRDYVEGFALTRFGPSGAVEGDPAVAYATSPLDYVARHLAAHYLGGAALPEAAPDAEAGTAPGTVVGAGAGAPELPLDLPRSPKERRRALRLVEG